MALRGLFFCFGPLRAGHGAGSTNPIGLQHAGEPIPRPHANPPSAILQPSLDILHTALGEMAVDKWKASSAIRTEAGCNLRSVQRDLSSTLPPLLAAADAAPDSAAKILPVYRNVEALYDVMLRLDAAARLAAPGNQSLRARSGAGKSWRRAPRFRRSGPGQRRKSGGARHPFAGRAESRATAGAAAAAARSGHLHPAPPKKKVARPAAKKPARKACHAAGKFTELLHPFALSSVHRSLSGRVSSQYCPRLHRGRAETST